MSEMPLNLDAPCSSGIHRSDHLELQPGSSHDIQMTSEDIKEINRAPADLKIGFIGLGVMGQYLVKSLINSGHHVTVWNRTTEKCEDFIKAGASSALTPSDLVEKCDIIFCCVSGPDASKSLVFGNDGILAGFKRCEPGKKGYVEMTTIDPTTSLEIKEAIEANGGRYLEALICGSEQEVLYKDFILLCAGDLELFYRCESCFDSFDKTRIFLDREVGLGSKLNLFFRMFMDVMHIALVEAMLLVKNSGLSQDKFLEILKDSPLNTTFHSKIGQALLNCNPETSSILEHKQKDMTMALALANVCSQPLWITSSAKNVFRFIKRIYWKHDVSAANLGAKD